MLRATPIFSTTFLVWRMPAVSNKINGMPLRLYLPSTTSRVVPAKGETMAFSSCSKAFKRVDFPTLGFPTIATFNPS